MITAAIARAARSSTNVKPLLRLLLRNNRHTARISVDAHLMLRLFTRKLEHGPLKCSIGMEAGNCESSRHNSFAPSTWTITSGGATGVSAFGCAHLFRV